MEKLTAAEKKVARLIQRDIPLVKRPFQETGRACDLNEAEVLNITRHLQKEGYIRRFAAILRHQKAGYTRNALLVWSVPPDQIEEAGKVLAAFPFISHCYERKPAFQNKYNLFTMLHTQNENIELIIKQMAQSINSNDYAILESLQEYKKISPEYF
ncbi:MAG: Lrp/AsnC family transcriptional regulator [Deltaproteobacteria bacterium HGW-Deltaproteobacteria-10]|nr:MAG: Lrp/AsnC family transcriptional regulator [Deltaproteobacteria bacterium HGW-Deltaproteobacteria-10]